MQQHLNNARQGAYFRTFPLYAGELDSGIDFAEVFRRSPTEIQEIVEDFYKAYEDYTDGLTNLVRRLL